jgi:NAD dependent epimerase/dehydratase
VLLITGAEGFIGSHLTEHLLRQGHRVRALVWYNSFNRLGWLAELPAALRENLEIVPGDVRDAGQMLSLMAGCKAVLHLAALIGIPYSYQAPQSYLATNAQGTLNLLEAARHHQPKRVLITSTSEVYGTARYVPIDEAHPLQPQSPYSASKIAADSLALSYWHSFALPVTLVRPFNTYGPRQSARAIIPAIIQQLLAGKTKLQLGDLRPTRDLCFVGDTVRAFEAILAEPGSIGQTLNIATGVETTMQQLADTLIEQIRPGTPIVQDPARLRPADSEVQRLCGDASRLRQLTGWQPSVELTDGLRQTIEWFRARPAMDEGYVM